MSEDFEAGMRDLHARAADAHAGGAGFPTMAMAGQVRRNRRVRAIGVSMVTVIAVLGVAWAGSAVAGLGDPAPIQPAESSDTPEPPDTPVPGEYTGPACGTVIGELAVFDEPPLVIEVTLDRGTLPPAEPLTGRVLLAVPGEVDITFQPDGMLEGLDHTAVQDGVVVGYGRSALVDGTWQALSGRQGVTALTSIQLQPCGGASTLAAGDYQLFASMPLTGAGDGQDEAVSRTILGGPWPFTVLDDRWNPVDISAVPVDVPGSEERLLRAEAHADGLRWRVDVEFDECRDMHGRAREAFIEAGFAVVSEGSDPERPFWSRGTFRGDDFDVELETSNETGGGCFGDYLVSAR